MCPASFTLFLLPSSWPEYFLVHVAHPYMFQIFSKFAFLNFCLSPLVSQLLTYWPESSFGFFRAVLWKTEMNFSSHSMNFFYLSPEGSSPFLKILSHSRCLTTSTDPSKLPPLCLLPFWTFWIYVLCAHCNTLLFYLVLPHFQLFE